MRFPLLIVPSLILTAPTLGADKPIPQDISKVEKRARERLEWYRRSFAGAYDKVGSKDPRWDEKALALLDLVARQNGERGVHIPREDVTKAGKAAIDAGCDDPLVVSIYERSVTGAESEREMIRRKKAAYTALVESRYPARRRASALEGRASVVLTQRGRDVAASDSAKADIDAALALLAESAREEEPNRFWEEWWFEYLNDFIADYRKLGIDPPKALERVDVVLAKVPEAKAIRLPLRGKFWLDYGWEARTTAFAPAVPAGAFQTFEERLTEAKKAFEAAWELDHEDARSATSLLDIDKAIGGDRATMELWFERAMTADADRYGACLTKLDWLDPKWHGNLDEMIAFGRACKATKNWQAGLTLLDAEAHRRYASKLPVPERRNYVGSPQVWSEIRGVYEEYLGHYPLSNEVRSKYAAMAYVGGHWQEAHAQFQILGDTLTSWPTFPNFPLASLQRMRDEVAKWAASEAAKKGGKP